MAATEKVSITLPKPLLSSIERLRRRTGETRSGIIQRALDRMLKEQERSARRRQYLDGYARVPETEEEIDAAEAAAVAILSREPWEQ